MKRVFYILLPLAGLIVYLWLQNQRRPVKVEAGIDRHEPKRPPDAPAQTPAQAQSGKAMATDMADVNIVWAKAHSAGLVISQALDPESGAYKGTIAVGGLKILLGETPPIYRYHLQAAGYPIMLGDQHDRQYFQIHLRSLIIKPNGVTIEAPLIVTYPRYDAGDGLRTVGLETSGGLVFKRDEAPLTKVGVIVPKVIPEKGEPLDSLAWQIQIRVNDRMGGDDMVTKAKPHPLGSDVVVLMPTHPNRIPVNAHVVWFKFNKDGTVSLADE